MNAREREAVNRIDGVVRTIGARADHLAAGRPRDSAVTGPVERVPLTDEQITEYERWALGGVGKPGGGLNDFGSRVALELIAELGASRAREQAQRTLREHAEHVKVELRAERDELRQRIDKALEITSLRVVGPARLVAKRYEAALRAAAAALTGAEAPDA